VIDCKHIVQHLDEEKPEGAENEAVEQVAFADKLLLNKTDLVSEEEGVAIVARLREINKVAPIVHCQNAIVPMEELLNIRAFDLERVLQIEPDFLADGEHMHDQTVTSVGITLEVDLDMDLVQRWIGTLLQEKGVDIFRMKGVLAIAGQDCKFVFQGVHMLFDGQPSENWKPDEKRCSKLIFIGKNLNREELTSGFTECSTAAPAEDGAKDGGADK